MTNPVSVNLPMWALVAALLAVMSTPWAAYGQTDVAASAGEPKYLPTQWTKRCFKQGKKNVCLTLIDRYAARPGGQPFWLAAAALREVQGEKNKAFTVRVPLGVYLQNGIIYKIDKGKAKRIPFSVCIRQGCQAIFPVEPAFMKSLKRGGQFQMQITRSNGKNIQISIPLKGFTKANDMAPPPASAQTSGRVKQPKAAPRLRKSTKGDAPAQ